jgi:pyruvate dehydrogenase (quinone)
VPAHKSALKSPPAGGILGASELGSTVADYVLRRLREWDVHRIFGYPGDGINGFLGALDRADGDPEFIQVRHEEMSAFMACGHAKFTGQLGVCLATSGPGAIHLLNGLYDAELDRQPVIALVGQQKRMSLGSRYQQEVDLPTLFKDVSGYVQVCMDPVQARHLVDRAVRIALDQRTVTTLIFPNDVQDEEAVEEPPRVHGAVFSGVGYTRPTVRPPETELVRAAEILNEGERVAMLVGQGALGASDEVVQVAEVLGAGIAKALLGRAAVPDDLPFVTGSIGLLGTRPTYELMRECDTLLMVGSSFPYAEWLPRVGQARGVQIDLDGRMIGLRYPMEANLVGDARETLRGLLPHLHPKRDGAWRKRIEAAVEDWWELVEDRAQLDVEGVNPQRVVWELNASLPDDAILAADSGSSTVWWARNLRLRSGMAASVSGTLASMGCAVPYAIAAKLAHPERPVVAFLGDGAFQMNGMNELLTVAKYRRRLGDQRLVFCVFNNRDLNMVTWEQRALAGDPKYPASQEIPDFPAARYAELLGLQGIKVEKPDDVAAAWTESFASDRPTVIEAIVDPSVPPVPPHIDAEQAMNLASALVKGDPDRHDVMEHSLREKLLELLPRR